MLAFFTSKVNGKDVIFCSRATDKPNNLVRLNKKIENELVRRNFPSIYEKYISGEPYTSIETTDGYSYQLFYYKGKLILKKLKVASVFLALVSRLIREGKIQVDEKGVALDPNIEEYFDHW